MNDAPLEMTAEERKESQRLVKYWMTHGRGDFRPLPTNIRLTFKRWLEAIETFVCHHRASMIVSADHPDCRILGANCVGEDLTTGDMVAMSVYVPHDVVILQVTDGSMRNIHDRCRLLNRLAKGEIMSVNYL